MGGNLSALFKDPSWSPHSPSKTSLGDLPEGCVALILRYLDPPAICRLAGLNQAFRGASLADFVWESKLPSNYRDLFQKVFGDFPGNSSKRDIYAKLCQPNFVDGNTKNVWLDKVTGGVCLSISSKGLAITGIDDRRYWKNIPTEESRFHSVAYLQQIWWLEIDGEVDFPFPTGTYSLFFRLQLGRTTTRFGHRFSSQEHIHGWDLKPVRFQLWTSEGQYASMQCYLTEPGKWILYHVGDFVVEKPKAGTKMKFSMTQIDCTHTKGGLCLDSVLIYPREYKRRLKQF